MLTARLASKFTIQALTPGACLVPIAWRSDDVEGTVIDRQSGFLDRLLREPIPCGSLSLFEVHDRNTVGIRKVIGEANPRFRVPPFPSGQACHPDSRLPSLVVSEMAAFIEQAPVRLLTGGEMTSSLPAF